jgi:hypothetical protein
LRIFFAGDPEGLIPFVGNDLHLNDTRLTATELPVPPGYVDGTKYQALASISDAVDVDFYEFRSADFGPGSANVISILVENVAGSHAPFDVTVYSATGQVLPYTNLINHGGRRLIQLQNVSPAASHFVRIATPGGATGNYRMSIVSGTQADSYDTLVEGSMSDQQSMVEWPYFVTRTEMTMFTFLGDPNNSPTQNVRLSIRTLSGQPVLEILSAANSFASAESLILRNGTYRIRVEKVTEPSVPLSFDINRFVVADPLAVPRLNHSSTPVVSLREFTDIFVFPVNSAHRNGLSTSPGVGGTTGPTTAQVARPDSVVALGRAVPGHTEGRTMRTPIPRPLATQAALNTPDYAPAFRRELIDQDVMAPNAPADPPTREGLGSLGPPRLI